MADKSRKKLHHWNTPGHAHELTFSCYRLVASPADWKWSSAYARFHKTGLEPDEFTAPVLLPNAQSQRIGLV